MRINEENRRRNGHVLIWEQPELSLDDKKNKSKMFNVLNAFLSNVHFVCTLRASSGETCIHLRVNKISKSKFQGFLLRLQIVDAYE